MATPEAVRSVVDEYVAASNSGDREAVLALFAPDAVWHDPVGQPPLVAREPRVQAEHAQCPRRSGFVALERLDRARLAGTVPAEQCDHFTGAGFQVEPVDRRERAVGDHKA